MKAAASLLYLREEELTDGIELFFFAGRDFGRDAGRAAERDSVSVARTIAPCILLRATRGCRFRIC